MRDSNRLACLLLALLLLPLGAAMAQHISAPHQEEELQVNPDHDRIIKLHPLQLGEVYLSYEKMRADRVSNEFGLSYIYKAYLDGSSFFVENDKAVNGIAIRMSQRHYTSKKRRGTPFGFFHGPMFGYRFMAFEDNALEVEQDPSSPDYRYVGRLYQNSLELNYQLGWQFKLGQQFTGEVSGALGGRVKYALAKGAGDLLADYIIGHELVTEENSAIFVVPSPQLNISVGYSF
ncbi:ABC transporter ATP-binding protein [Pontibacter oryzae]|uniref:ABC transporter ATP-binding protein n=1 Tax=Pontibacter oryzae TaxID=2304593 RepID=A0A399S186_9BACT|nr:ABC transporter ATP-binding protein [Pontibacter oryzae]RIJ37786.1 ABC transporter ATP-binding protein [Pontibacter oryzae]